jgi:hypothetical protein
MAKHCGAKTKAGGSCQRAPMPNGRCWKHGGASTGPKDTTNSARNALKHGIYATRFSEDEIALRQELKRGSVDEELDLMRLRRKLSMLEQPKRIFHQFKKANRDIYDRLEWFVKGIELNGLLPNTFFQMQRFRLVADMVNEKKHSRVIEYNVEPNEKIFVGSEGDSFLFDKDFRNDHPNIRVRLPVNSSARRVAAYRFAANGIDVYDLCLFAVHATQIVMDVFYDAYFEPGEKVFKPDVPIVTTGLATDFPDPLKVEPEE